MQTIAIFCNTDNYKDTDLAVFDSWEDFEQSQMKPKGFWVDSSYEGDIQTLAYDIRKSEYWYYLICTESSCKCELTDSQADLEPSTIKFTFMHEQILTLDLNIEKFNDEEKLLFYLYLRENSDLNAKFKPNSLKLYTYPIVDIILGKEDNIDWLTNLVDRGLFQFQNLIDRVRLCNKCVSAHLYFRDLCPHCNSIKIKQSSILHCFTCGNVAKEHDFQTDGGLVCSKCHTHLKQIGVDYDLPAAQYSCSDCHHIFEEPEVAAKCIDCGTSHEPEKLHIYEIYTLRLTLLGREFLLLDKEKIIFSMFSKSLKHIKTEEFILFLDWMILVNKRKDDFAFAIVLLEFSNLNEIIDFYGFTKMNTLFEELSRRLLELIRDTDMLSIDNAHKVWILLPNTIHKGIEKRLDETIKAIQPKDGPALEIYLNIMYSNEHLSKETFSAKSIMDELLQRPKVT